MTITHDRSTFDMAFIYNMKYLDGLFNMNLTWILTNVQSRLSQWHVLPITVLLIKFKLSSLKTHHQHVHALERFMPVE